MDPATVAAALAVLVAAAAAVMDIRTGLISNWLTLPVVVLAPAIYGVLGGWPGLGAAAIGLIACGLPPYLLFLKGAAGGGDVKLFAAIGALTGLSVGLEAEFLSFVAAAMFSLGRLAWRGRLGPTLKNSLWLIANSVLPKRWRRPIEPEAMSSVRLGGFALIGMLGAIALELERHHP